MPRLLVKQQGQAATARIPQHSSFTFSARQSVIILAFNPREAHVVRAHIAEHVRRQRATRIDPLLLWAHTQTPDLKITHTLPYGGVQPVSYTHLRAHGLRR